MIACIVLLLWLKRLFTFGRQKAQLSNTKSNLLWPVNNFFLPKDSPIAEEHKPLEKKTSLCAYACLYICYKRSIQKNGVCKRTLCIRSFLCCKVILNLASGRLFLFKRFLLHLSSQLDTALKYFSVFLMFVVVLLRERWVAQYTLESNGSKRKKSHLVLINLLKWSEHFVRETMLHVGKIVAGALHLYKWMQTHLPKNDLISKNDFGVQGP